VLDFLQENDVIVGLILGSLLLPLIVDFMKRRWDREKEERDRRVLEFRERQQATLTKRLEIVDKVTTSYMEFIIGIKFILLDFERKRLDSELGRRHRASYDEHAQAFLSESSIFPLQVGQYFERANTLEQRMNALADWAASADAAVTMLAESPPDIGEEEIDKRWSLLDVGMNELGNAVHETVRELAAEVKPDAEFAEDQPISWKVTEIKVLIEARSYQLR
jgi:hypothetical protein